MAKGKRIALVTGANKGIGFEVVRQLARKGFHVFLGARNSDAGVAAVQKLNKEGEKEDYGHCFEDRRLQTGQRSARGGRIFEKKRSARYAGEQRRDSARRR